MLTSLDYWGNYGGEENNSRGREEGLLSHSRVLMVILLIKKLSYWVKGRDTLQQQMK